VSQVSGPIGDVRGPYKANFKVNATVNATVNAPLMRAASQASRSGGAVRPGSPAPRKDRYERQAAFPTRGPRN
jgi:hypothetical protein